MTRHENLTPAEEAALNAAQVEFSMNPRFFAPQAGHLLQAQERVLDQVERFSSAWFQRRHEAMQSMFDAGRQMVSQGQPGPASAMMAIAEWQTGSMQRLAEDARDSAEMLSRCAGAFVAHGGDAAQDSPDTEKRADKTGK